MIFQGQELLEDEWFRDDPIDWTKADTYADILGLYRDLIALCRDRQQTTRGLRGPFVTDHHVNEPRKVLAFHRWDASGPGDDVVVIANLANRSYQDYRVGLPRPGPWHLRCNTDWKGYSPDFGAQDTFGTVAVDSPHDGLAWSAGVGLPPYTALIYSRTREQDPAWLRPTQP